MADEFLHSLTDIWNGGSTTFYAIKMNVTDTASASDSKLIDLQVGGVTQFNVGKNGNVVATGNYTGVNGVFSGTMGVTGNATFGGTLAVTGNATFTGTVNGTTIPTSATLVTTARQVATGTGLSGGGNLSADRTIALANTAVAAGSYGSASAVGTFTVDAQGRLTTAASTNIAIAGTAITSGTVADARLPTTQAGKTFSSAVQFASGTDALPGMTFSGDVDTGIWRPAADTLAASTNGSERLRITSTGNVGIGTSSPGGILEVNGSNAAHGNTGIPTTPTLELRRVTSDAGNYAGMVIRTGASNSDFGLYSNQNGALFYHGGSERLRITSDGNVGIGTSAPAGKLHVQTDTTKNAVFKNQTHDTLTGLGTGLAFARGSDGAGDLSSLFAWNNGGIGIAGRGGIVFATGGATGSANTVESMRITSDGNVGIGTSSPGGRLTVQSATGRAGFQTGTSVSPERGNIFYDTDGSGWKFNIGKLQAGTFTSQMTFQDNGNVGIGTSAPSAAALLDVTSTTKGFLPPRMTTTQRDAITSPPNGLLLYNSTTNKMQARAGGAWVDLH